MRIPEQIGPYRIERELGRGGMATVYLADDQKHGRKVAIKFLLPEISESIGKDRFLREIEVAARLTHPHILPLFDSGAVDGELYYVMPYIAGESMRALLDREKQLPLDNALRLTREIAAGLGHAHQHGLVHRDVKPENVLLADGVALVADFGIARALSKTSSDSTVTRSLTSAGSTLGTPLYMAPEQALGQCDVDARADLYALGCTLYEMLAGQPPFDTRNLQALIAQHLNDPVPPLPSLRPGIPESIVRVIEKALAKTPADRYASMAQFAEALALASTGRPTPVGPPEGSVVSTNLPKERTRFIGREKALSECARLLGDSRLFTLTGVGGSGKTRLATHLAESLLETFVDGVWFIDLAPVEEETLVAEVVANTLDVKGDPGEAAEDAIIAHLQGKRTLLLLDNCEHVLRPVADLADRLLSALSELRLLVTSREGLGIDGERLFVVGSLDLPRKDGDNGADAMRRTEAVRLFESRATDVNPGFQLDPSNVRVVADICRRLDGIPLAIELAAARTRALSVDQIARMLDDRFRLLTGGSRSVLERHRTLRATVQWSYDHLEPEEQELFVALSVCAGGWTLNAAAHLIACDEFDVLDRLSHLIDKSMIGMERSAGGDARYRMLETLRQFGLEELAASGRADTLRAAHLRFFLEFVKGMETELREAFPIAAVNRLKEDVANLRAAMTWGFQNDPLSAVELNRRLVRMWFSQGYYEEGRRWYAQTLELGEAIPSAARTDAMARSGRLALQQGNYDEALRHYNNEVQIYRAEANHHRCARALVRIAKMLTYFRRHDEARPLYEEARTLYAGLDDDDGVERLEGSLGLDALLRGDLHEARERFQVSLRMAREHGNPDRTQVALANLCVLDLMEAAPATARSRLSETLAINRELRNLYGIAHQLPMLAETFRLAGDASRAAQLIGTADTLLEDAGAALEPVEEGVYDRTVAALRSELGEETFERERQAGMAIPWEEAIALAGA